jgi:hypothetical protein
MYFAYSILTETKRCRISGDPHYYTFDNVNINYQGVCVYTLAETHNLEAGDDLTEFTINSKPEHRNGNKRVSWTQYIEIDIYGAHIKLDKGRKVYVSVIIQAFHPNLTQHLSKVDELEVELPYQVDPKWRIFLSGSTMVFEAENGVTVKFNGVHYGEIHVPVAYAAKLQGICGNMDNNRDNDYMTKEGVKTTKHNDIGESYVVAGAIDNEG